MKNLILTTASVLALGVAGSGIGNAADPYNSSPNTPGASTQTPSTTTMSQSTQAATAPVDASESQVKQAQERLKSTGFYKGTADGKMGPETKQAISEFQQQQGLTKTGTLDQETLAALNSNQSSGGSSVSGSTTQPSSSGAAGSLNPSTAPSSR